MRQLTILFSFAAAAPLVSQSSLSVSVPNPTTITASVGVQTSSFSFGGALPVPEVSVASVDLGAIGLAVAQVSNTVEQDAAEVRCFLALSGSVFGPNASMNIPAHDWLLTLNPPVNSGLVRFTFASNYTATAGVPAPTLQYDLFDDGIVEVTGVASQPVVLTTYASFAPIRIRIRAGFSLSTALVPSASCGLSLSLGIARYGAESVLPALPGCGFNELDVRPAWDVSGVALRMPQAQWPGSPHVAVFGLGADIVPLSPPPITSPLQPCLLLPSPDLLVLMPPSLELVLPIPASVRPIALYTQVVVVPVFVAGLETTNAVMVLAH